MTAPLPLTLPLPPNLGNARMHWRTKLRAKKSYWGDCDLLWHAGLLPKGHHWAKAEITAHVVVGNRMDVDNLFARLKWAIDWIAYAGYIENDDPRHLHWAGIPTQEVSRKNANRIEIILTPISPVSP